MKGHCIITGGSSGIGLALARLMVKGGADVTLIARTQADLDSAVQELRGLCCRAKQRIQAFSADVAQQAALNQALQEAIGLAGAPALLVCCAGICHPGRVAELGAEVFERTNAVNYMGSVYSVLAALPAMRQARAGHIVLVSSGAGLIGVTGYAAYGPTKFAVRGLGEVLRAELKPHGIGVSVVFPPDTDTPQLQFERRLQPPETAAITGTARMLPAAEVASAIQHGVHRRRFVITPGWEMTVLHWLPRMLHPLLHRYFDRLSAATLRREQLKA